MAYRGIGTQDDPYIVDNWTDFKALCSSDEHYIAFDPDAENKVIDLNETEDRGGLQSNLLFHAKVNGNGWRIRNLVTNGYFLGMADGWNYAAITAENLHFENLIVQGGKLFYGNCHFVGCSFSGYLFNDAKLFSVLNVSGGYVEACTFNLHVNRSMESIFSCSMMLHCNIRLTGKLSGSISEGNEYVWMRNCSVTGSVELNGGILELGTSPYDENIMIALQCRGTGSIRTINSAASACIIDRDLIDDPILTDISTDNWYTLSTEQMQNADYLIQTVGFPCVQI
ncbi:MAG: hypothetical protein E7504_00825 [Ruminococcus sp.]|nr:hypothetical protein [Ruminococcus sp.]